MVEDPFYIISYDGIHYANEYGPICRLKECPTGSVRVGSECLSCDDPNPFTGITDSERDPTELTRQAVVMDACNLCTNREYIPDRGICRLKQCPPNWFRTINGGCTSCVSLQSWDLVHSVDDCTCSNRTTQPFTDPNESLNL